jgi:hypothetical protein
VLFLPVIPAHGRWRQKDCEFQFILEYLARPYLKKKKGKGREGRQEKKERKRERKKSVNYEVQRFKD